MARAVASRPKADRWFFLAMAAWLVATFLVGFGTPILWRLSFPGELPPVSVLATLQGLALLSWVTLFLVQVLLIRRSERSLHKRIGLAAMASIGLVLLIGYFAVIEQYDHGSKTDTAAVFELIQTGMGVVLAALGVALNRRPFIHKRLMLGSVAFLASAGAEAAMEVIGLFVPPVPYGEQVAIFLPFIALCLYDLAIYRRPWLALTLTGWFALIQLIGIEPLILDRLGGRSIIDGLTASIGLAA